MTERRPVPGYEGFYEASSDGGIYSLTREVARKNGSVATHHGGPLKISRGDRGNPQVRLSRDGVSRLHQAARVILSAFHPNFHPDDIAVPIDGNYANLHIDNLVWMSRTELADLRR